MVLLVGFDVEGLELDGVDELGVDDEGVDDDGVDELGFELDGVVLDGAELDGLDDEEEESSEVDGAATLLEVESSSRSSSSSIDVDGEVLAVLLTVVSTWGMNAGGGVVSTEVAAAMATPPRMATAPMPMAMLAARLEIRLEVMSS